MFVFNVKLNKFQKYCYLRANKKKLFIKKKYKMLLTENFAKAISDYIYFLEKDYPQKSVSKLISDRYSLNGIERTILYRGVTTRKNSIYRSSKLVTKEELINQSIYIDGYNVLITIGSYLNGNTVFIGTDNFLRDASEIHGKIFRTELFERAIVLILTYLKEINIKDAYFYIDKPVSFSGNLCLKINQHLEDFEIKGKAETCDSPDFILKHLEKGFCATSDSTIIDKSKVKIFDLARNTLSLYFKTRFVDLSLVKF